MNPSLRAGAVLVVLGFAPAALAEPLGAQAAQKDMAALTATALPAVRQQADAGDARAQCVLGQLYERGQAAPRPTDNAALLRFSCARSSHEPSGRPLRPAPPALPSPASPQN